MSFPSLLTSLGSALHAFFSPQLPSSSPIPTSKSDGMHAFEAELAAQIEQLKAVNDTGYLGVSWLSEAMGVVLSTHSNVGAFVTDLHGAVAQGYNKWLDKYLDESVTVLDFCNVLRIAVSDIRSYQSFVDLALQSLEHGRMQEAQLVRGRNALLKCSQALKRRDENLSLQCQKRSKLGTCSSIVRFMGEKLNLLPVSKQNFFNAIHAAQITTMVICEVLSAALSVKPRLSLSRLYVAAKSPWAFSLSNLHQSVKDQVNRKKAKSSYALLEELEKEDLGVRVLKELVDKALLANTFPLSYAQTKDIRKAVKVLRSYWEELYGGLTKLEQNINEVFGFLISNRMVLLSTYTHF